MSELAKRSFLYFFVSFVGTGLQNVVPQVFFDQYYPESRELLLSICLLAGASASILGSAWWSHAQLKEKKQSLAHVKQTILLTIILLGLALLGLFITTFVYIFILMFVMTKVLAQYLLNTVDDHYVRSTISVEMNKHAQQATLLQLLGIVVAPVYFSFLHAHPMLNGGVLVFLCMLTAYLILTSINPEVKKEDGTRQQQESKGRLDLKDYFFLFYIITTSAATLIFSANIIYLLQDYFVLESPIQKGGLLLGVVNITAILGVVFQKMISKALFGRQGNIQDAAGSLRIHLGIPVLSVIMIFLLYIKWSSSMIFLTLLFALMGIFYGLFRLFTREYASQMATLYQKRLLLTIYNNMSNYSIIIASLCLFILSLLDTYSRFTFLPSMLWCVMGLFFMSGVAVICFGSIKVEDSSRHNSSYHSIK